MVSHNFHDKDDADFRSEAVHILTKFEVRSNDVDQLIADATKLAAFLKGSAES